MSVSNGDLCILVPEFWWRNKNKKGNSDMCLNIPFWYVSIPTLVHSNHRSFNRMLPYELIKFLRHLKRKRRNETEIQIRLNCNFIHSLTSMAMWILSSGRFCLFGTWKRFKSKWSLNSTFHFEADRPKVIKLYRTRLKKCRNATFFPFNRSRSSC